MVYGVLRFINFAHSDVFMVGVLHRLLRRQAGPGGTPSGAASWCWRRHGGLRPAGHAHRAPGLPAAAGGPTLNVLITAIGVSLLLEYSGQVFSGRRPAPFPRCFPPGISMSRPRALVQPLLVIMSAAVLMVALQFIVHRTKIGTAMRAVALNPQAAQLVGINNNVVIAFTFGLGSALAGAGASSTR